MTDQEKCLHNHSFSDTHYADCPACRKYRRNELEADVDFWGGTVTWSDEESESVYRKYD